MRFNIEGWIPTELEQSLMDGSFDKNIESVQAHLLLDPLTQ